MSSGIRRNTPSGSDFMEIKPVPFAASENVGNVIKGLVPTTIDFDPPITLICQAVASRYCLSASLLNLGG